MRVSLLSTTCSTSSFGSGRGDLWLTDESLVRIGGQGHTARTALAGGLAGSGVAAGLFVVPHPGLGVLAGAVGAGIGAFVYGTGRRPAPREGTTLEVSPQEWAEHLEVQDGALVLPLAGIVRAEVSSGERGTLLTVTLADDQEHTLRCGRSATLEATLRQALPTRLMR